MQFCTCSILMIVILSTGFLSPASASLPEIPGFSAEATRTTPLSAPSGNFGDWTSRTYRTAGGRILEATLMSGPGAGPLVTGDEGAKHDDRPLGFGATYEVFLLGGKRAVLETLPSVGISLALELGENVTLTLESSSLSREDLETAALHILRSL